jgi:hypothetical protein
MTRRLVFAIALLVAMGGLLWWTAQGPATVTAPPTTGDFTVFIVGAEGAGMANGTVHSVATPFHALRALAGQRNLTVLVEQQAWIGSGCTATYVTGIGGLRESGSGGWNYYIRQPGGDWTWKPDGAACYALAAGDQVEWCWVEGDVCRRHAA